MRSTGKTNRTFCHLSTSSLFCRFNQLNALHLVSLLGFFLVHVVNFLICCNQFTTITIISNYKYFPTKNYYCTQKFTS